MTKNPMVDFAEDAEKMAKPTDEQIRKIAELTEFQIGQEDTILILEALINAERVKLDRVRTVLLPEAMKEIGIQRIDLDTGERLTIRAVIGGSIKIENRDKAHRWLRDHGFGSLIKNEVMTRFGMGKEKRARDLLTFLLKKGYEAESKESVHSQTLSAFVREQIEAGRKIPMDLLGVFQYDEAKVTRKK